MQFIHSKTNTKSCPGRRAQHRVLLVVNRSGEELGKKRRIGICKQGFYMATSHNKAGKKMNHETRPSTHHLSLPHTDVPVPFIYVWEWDAQRMVTNSAHAQPIAYEHPIPAVLLSQIPERRVQGNC